MVMTLKGSSPTQPGFTRMNQSPGIPFSPALPSFQRICVNNDQPPHSRFPALAFFSAIASGDIDLVSLILEKDHYFITQDNGYGSPLHFAIIYGQLEVVKFLLRRGAEINQRDALGLTPLHHVAYLLRKISIKKLVPCSPCPVQPLQNLTQKSSTKVSSMSGILSKKAAKKIAKKAARKERKKQKKLLQDDMCFTVDSPRRCGYSESDILEMYEYCLSVGADPYVLSEISVTDSCVSERKLIKPTELITIKKNTPNRKPIETIKKNTPNRKPVETIKENTPNRSDFLSKHATILMKQKVPFEFAPQNFWGKLRSIENKYRDIVKVAVPHAGIGDWWILQKFGGIENVKKWEASKVVDYPVMYPNSPLIQQQSVNEEYSSRKCNSSQIFDTKNNVNIVEMDRKKLVKHFSFSKIFENSEISSDETCIQREDVDGVEGAFILRNVLQPKEIEALVKIVRSINTVYKNPRNYKTSTKDNKDNILRVQSKARRQSTAALLLRASLYGKVCENHRLYQESLVKRFCNPLELIPPTDDIAGRPCEPVEPVKWNVPKHEMRKLCSRLRPHLPKYAQSTIQRLGTSTINNGEKYSEDQVFLGNKKHKKRRKISKNIPKHPLDKNGHELSTLLRCYQYSVNESSIPHFDKSYSYSYDRTRSDGDVVQVDAYSAYSILFYLNDDYGGGYTTFFQEKNIHSKLHSKFHSNNKSRSGLTWSNDGNGRGIRSIYETVTRVKGNRGDCLIFPHGGAKGCHHSPLHEGSAVREVEDNANVDKCLIRTDIMFTKRVFHKNKV